jgi:hypothetical protein
LSAAAFVSAAFTSFFSAAAGAAGAAAAAGAAGVAAFAGSAFAAGAAGAAAFAGSAFAGSDFAGAAMAVVQNRNTNPTTSTIKRFIFNNLLFYFAVLRLVGKGIRPFRPVRP